MKKKSIFNEIKKNRKDLNQLNNYLFNLCSKEKPLSDFDMKKVINFTFFGHLAYIQDILLRILKKLEENK